MLGYSFFVTLEDMHYQPQTYTGQITHLSEDEAADIACGIIHTDPFIQVTKNPANWKYFKKTPRIKPPLPDWAKEIDGRLI